MSSEASDERRPQSLLSQNSCRDTEGQGHFLFAAGHFLLLFVPSKNTQAVSLSRTRRCTHIVVFGVCSFSPNLLKKRVFGFNNQNVSGL